MFYSRNLFLIYFTVFFVASALLLPNVGMGFEWLPNSQNLVGTNTCPKLNAHDKKACRFKRKKHGFQVWPRRIQIQPTTDQTVFLVTDTGHQDRMFDHTLRLRKDDHIKFQCIVKNDGTFIGPINFRIKRGGVWKTYGTPIVVAATLTAGAIAAIVSGGTAAGIAGPAGGSAAEALGKELAKHGSKSWEKQAGKLASDICSVFANQGKQNWARAQAAETRR